MSNAGSRRRRRSGVQAPTSACSKNGYPDQAQARLALTKILEKGKATARQPVRVYPCDTCDQWHLTAKRNIGRTPPWDVDPDWIRPRS